MSSSQSIAAIVALSRRAGGRGRAHNHNTCHNQMQMITINNQLHVMFSSTSRRAMTSAKARWQVATSSSASRWQPYHKLHYMSASVSVSGVPCMLPPSPVVQVQGYAFSSAAAAASPKKRKKKKCSQEHQNQVKVPNQDETSPLALSSSFVPENQRRILTEAVALQDPTIVALQTMSAMSHYASHNAKSLLHNAKHKLMFQEHLTYHQIMGAAQEPLFVATRTTTLDLDCIELHSTNIAQNLREHPHVTFTTSTSNDNRVELELVTRGAAPSKKRAELLAAVDTMALLHQVGIDIRDPPNLVALQKQKETQKQQQAKQSHKKQETLFSKTKLDHAQMMLELVNASRPTFSNMEQNVKQQTWTATASVLVRGTCVEATGLPARKKSHAEGNALISLVNDHIPQLIGDEEWNTYTSLTMKKKSNNQTAILKLPVLDDELVQELAATMGTWHDHELRQQRHGLSTLEYEWGLREKRLLQQEEQEEREAMMAMMEDGEWKQGEEHRQQLQHQQRLDAISKKLFKQEQKRLQKELHYANKHPDNPQSIMKQIRDALPIKQIQQELIQTLERQQVVVVSGGTGSGKSTQCPQYILEHALVAGKGAQTRIIVTQPRKIAAISVAERVAAERHDRIGNSVGYTVRFQRKPPRHNVGGSLEFVTTGVLLRRLLNDPTLDDISHVMIDEVHERDIDTDFLLILLRDLLAQRPDLRVILMSATLDAESFGRYFSKQNPHGATTTDNSDNNAVPVLSVPTQPRHPVEVFYLEDIAANNATTHQDATNINTNTNTKNNQHQFPAKMQKLATSLLRHKDEQLQMELEEALEEERAAEELEKLSRAEDEGETLESDSDSDSESESDSDSDELQDDNYYNEEVSSSNGLRLSYNDKKLRVETLTRAVSMRTSSSPSLLLKTATPTTLGAKKGNRRSRSQKQQQLVVDNDKFNPTEVMISLMVQIAHHLSQVETDAGRSGSILCFLPGLDEIKAATAELEETTHPRLKKKITILPLHSTIPQEDQQKVFEPANGKIKVIFSTNIAESSITIDDVLAVIDSGLVRELNFDAEAAMTKMETNSASRASATQRLGRAGRVAPGRCYRIYSRGDMEAMAERPTPEIQRTALEATCLQTCSMTNSGVANFLSRALDPPPSDAVSFAMDRLIKLGAISVVDSNDEKNGGEVLTPLGRCLSRLSLDPATGRMLMVAGVLKCLDPMLTAAACFSSRNVFNNPVGLRDEAQDVRRSFSDSSDIMAMTRAYDNFWDLVEHEGWHSAKEWAFDNFVSVPAMVSIQAVRFQLVEQLNTLGLIPASDMKRVGHRKLALLPDASVNENSNNEMLYSALWATAFPGNLAARRRHATFGTLRTQMDAHAGLHPSSVSFHRKPPKDTVKSLPSWYMYREMVLSSQVFLRDCSALEPYQVLVFGGFSLSRSDATTTTSGGSKEKRSRSRVRGVLDDWIIVEGPSVDTFDLLAIARNEITMALEYKAMHPKAALPEQTQNILNSICYMFDTMNEEKGDGLDNDTTSSLRGSLWGLLDTKNR